MTSPALTLYGAGQILAGTGIPTNLYVQAHIGEPGTDGTGNVATETSRVLMTRGAATTVGNSKVAENDAEVGWEDWPADETVTHFSWWDDIDAGQGNCWYVADEADGGEVVTTGQNVTFNIGEATFTLNTYVP